MRAQPALLRTPWPLAVAVVAGIVLGVAWAPLPTSAVLSVLTVLGVLVWRFGLREGLWYLLMICIPLRAALSIEVYETTSLFLGDFLALALLVEVAYRRGVADVWKRSPAFRIGLAIIALSVLGLYVATRAYSGFVSVFVILVQVALLFVARDYVRTAGQARRTLYAILVGLVVPILYGLYQSSLPLDSELPHWSSVFIAYSQERVPHLRVFSTFAHPLRFSHYLSVGFAIALGLAFSGGTPFRRLGVLFLAGAVALANYFTYSIGGFGAMLVGGGASLIGGLKRRATPLVVLLVVLLVFLAFTGTLADRAAHLMSGQSSSFAARLVTYQQAINVIRDHPLLGVGWGGIRSSLEGRYRIVRSDVVALVAENYFLHRGMALGLIGLALYGALFVLYFRNIFGSGGASAGGWPRAALLGGGVAFYLQAQVMPTIDGSGNYLLWVLIALSEAVYEAASRPGREIPE